MIKKWKKYENKNIKNYIYNIMSSGKKQKNKKIYSNYRMLLI